VPVGIPLKKKTPKHKKKLQKKGIPPTRVWKYQIVYFILKNAYLSGTLCPVPIYSYDVTGKRTENNFREPIWYRWIARSTKFIVSKKTSVLYHVY
jgi:hypothetical protein